MKLADVYASTPTEQSTRGYDGPTQYRGHEIYFKHSIRRVTKTLRRALSRSQFASLNVIGIPGSGKTVLVGNIVTDLVEAEFHENNEVYNVHWKGADELRNLGQEIENLPKHTNNILIFDDVSKALDQLSKPEQSELFEQLTTTRHTTQGRLLIISLYHYTFSDLKEVRSQGVVIIYVSVTLPEYGNISAMIPGTQGQKILKLFSRAYESAFMNGNFELKFSQTQRKVYEDGKPFRPCLVINLFKAHIGLFMKLDNQYQKPNDSQKETISNEILIKNITDAYGKDGLKALKWFCMIKGQPQCLRADFVRSVKFIGEKIARRYNINWEKMSNDLAPKDQKNLYRKRKQEKALAEKIESDVKETLQKVSDAIPEQTKALFDHYQKESENNDEF